MWIRRRVAIPFSVRDITLRALRGLPGLVCPLRELMRDLKHVGRDLGPSHRASRGTRTSFLVLTFKRHRQHCSPSLSYRLLPNSSETSNVASASAGTRGRSHSRSTWKGSITTTRTGDCGADSGGRVIFIDNKKKFHVSVVLIFLDSPRTKSSCELPPKSLQLGIPHSRHVRNFPFLQFPLPSPVLEKVKSGCGNSVPRTGGNMRRHK